MQVEEDPCKLAVEINKPDTLNCANCKQLNTSSLLSSLQTIQLKARSNGNTLHYFHNNAPFKASQCKHLPF